MDSFRNRLIRAAKLDVRLYEEVEADKSSMKQAIAVVVFSSVAAGLGAVVKGGGTQILIAAIGSLMAWYIWAFIVYIIGTKFLPEPQTKSDIGELLRTTGFSSSPGLIRVLGVIPIFRPVVFLVSAVWMLAAMVIAVRQALDYKSTFRAIGVCLIGWVIQILFLIIFAAVFGAGK